MRNPVLLQVCHRFGGQSNLARLLQTSPSRVNKWLNQGARIPYEYAFAIEQLTEGEFKCDRLSPFCDVLVRLPSVMMNRISILELQVKTIEERLKGSSPLTAVVQE